MLTGQRNRICIGSNNTSCSTTNATQPKWAHRRLKPFFLTWPRRPMSLLPLEAGYDTQCLRSGQVSARYRNCSGIKMSKRPWFTLMCSFADRRRCEAHWMSDAFGSGLLLPLPGVLSLHRPCQATLELAQIVLQTG
jgi:hypothetical protein